MDTDALINAWRRYYPQDIFPPLWEKFGEMIQNGDLIASEEVFRELNKQDDDLTEWAKYNSKMFMPIDTEIQTVVRDILRDFPKLINIKKSKSMADPWVIALAKIKNAKVVTGERPAHSRDKQLNSANTVKIPDICRILGIGCLDIVGFCRDTNLVFRF